MNTQTSLVAEQIRLQQWADQIRDCQNRPSDMKVDAWCRERRIIITACDVYERHVWDFVACIAFPEKGALNFRKRCTMHRNTHSNRFATDSAIRFTPLIYNFSILFFLINSINEHKLNTTTTLISKCTNNIKP